MDRRFSQWLHPLYVSGRCNKDMSGIMIYGHTFRFARCQFGQKTEGSALGSIVGSIGSQEFKSRGSNPRCMWRLGWTT